MPAKQAEKIKNKNWSEASGKFFENFYKGIENNIFKVI